MTEVKALTSSVSVEHYTPAFIVEAARRTMGGIDLDPASCVEADRTVGAARIFTKEDNGLFQKWYGRVFLNPPGGRLARNKSSQVAWWSKLVGEYDAGRTVEAVFFGYSLEILQTSQSFYPLSAFPMCFPKNRVKCGGDSPVRGSVIAYLGRRKMDFAVAFSEIGHVRV